VEQNIRVAGTQDVHVLIHAPLIVAPFPCDQGPPITLPQPVPSGLELGRFLRERPISTFKVFGVHPSQEHVWAEHMEREGILEMANAGGLTFTFLGSAQSEAVLNKGPILERRD